MAETLPNESHNGEELTFEVLMEKLYRCLPDNDQKGLRLLADLQRTTVAEQLWRGISDLRNEARAAQSLRLVFRLFPLGLDPRLDEEGFADE
ncbi:hypothetical protein [Nitrospira moscoviensis]|uniref:Uncharacterized protein n=1 Tax=Nitrospira moscoviensis TaxID=42253 RepID=A0A0K2GGX2_NITMO|nr:hypothetical protein [Nitrospira moscoviensis]ALA60186.1 hypothetical protein NITMOv2_3796 [Nitrospira moscoviensis]